jgi:hypothetical protein
MTIDGSTATVFRIARRTRVLMIALYLPIVFLSLVLLGLSTVLGPMIALAICLLLLGAFGLAYSIAFGIRSRVAFADGRYRQQFALTASTFTVDDVAKVVAVDALDYGLQSAAQLFVVGKLEPRLARLNDQLYERAEMEVLANDLAGRGIPIDHVQGRLTLAQFAQQRPGLLPYQEAKRTRFILIVAALSLVVFGAIGALSLVLAFAS